MLQHLYLLIDVDISNPEIRKYIFYVLVVFNVCFIAFVYISRYLTRNDEHNDEDL